MGAQIGPNALLQTIAAMHEAIGEKQTATIVTDANLLDDQPTHMVDEREFAALVLAMTAHLPPEQIHAILHRSGQLTADYLLAHRIPRPFQHLLKLLPRRVAMWALLAAISQHAWTFVGSGDFSFHVGRSTHVVVVHTLSSATDGFYGGTFEHLIHILIDAHAAMSATVELQADRTFCTYTFKRA